MSNNSPRPLNLICRDAEAELLLHCARVQVDPKRAERIGELVRQELDWDSLLSVAQRNGLLPLLSFHLNRICAPDVPRERLQYLRTYFQSNSALNLLLTAELVKLLDLFAANGICAVPYKGPATAVSVYHNLGLRQFGDLDILVREADVWKATDLLIAQGFDSYFVIPLEKQAAFIRLGYVRLFQRDGGRTVVELHWSIAPRFFDSGFDAGRIWSRLEIMKLQGSSVHVPAAADLLLMLCTHAAKDCWEKLEWVCCVAEVLKANPGLNWQRILEQAHKARCQRILFLGLLLAHDLLEAPLPADVVSTLLTFRTLPQLASQIVKDFFSPEPKRINVPARVRFHLRTKDRLRDRLRYCWRLSVTTTPVDWELMPLPRSVSFAYYPLRVFRLLKKYAFDSQEARS